MGFVHTAASAKGKSTNKKRSEPRTGTKIRELYDLFQSNRGVPIDYCTTDNRGAVHTRMEVLMDSYGLDIRRIRNGKWVLAGEWFGKAYIDYIQDRIKEE